MVSKILEVKPNVDYTVEVTFFDGSIRKYDLNEDAKLFPEYDELIGNDELFNTVKVDKSKTNICWDNGAKLSDEAIWFNSVLVETVQIKDASIAFADRLRALREAIGITQKELEERTGIYQADISKIEKGEANPSLSTMGRLFDGLGYDLQFFANSVKKKRADILVNESVAPFLPKDKGQGQFTIEDMMLIPEGIRVELIDGVIYDMAPPNFIHQKVIGDLHVDFSKYIEKNGGNCIVVEGPVGVFEEDKDDTYLIPDMVVVCDKGKIKEYGISGGPDFVLEVISKSTGGRDYKKKLAIYESMGVREYWIFDPIKKCVVVYDLEHDGSPEFHMLDEVVGVNIYDGKLKINLNPLKEFIENFFSNSQ